MNRLDQMLAEADGAPLLGASVNWYDPVFAEVAAALGFHILWIEMEHAPITFPEALDLCRIGQGAGLLTMIRIPDARRENVLKAAECGPDIIDLPMANTPEVVEEFVRHARYAPAGNRGFFGGSRAMRYGMFSTPRERQEQVNQELTLMAQIETREAVARADDLCRVPGLDAIFIGPGDLSASLGVTGETNHPSVVAAAEESIAVARRRGKRIALACAPADAGAWARRGVEMLFCASNLACLRTGAQALLEQARAGMEI